MHMPRTHREVAGWSAEKLTSRATAIGPRCTTLVERLLHQRRHPQQAFRSCLGVLRLGQEFGNARLEAACAHALKLNAVSWKSLQSILKNSLDLQTPPGAQRTLDLPEHENLRGAHYYQSNSILH
jgi:transposase